MRCLWSSHFAIGINGIKILQLLSGTVFQQCLCAARCISCWSSCRTQMIVISQKMCCQASRSLLSRLAKQTVLLTFMVIEIDPPYTYWEQVRIGARSTVYPELASWYMIFASFAVAGWRFLRVNCVLFTISQCIILVLKGHRYIIYGMHTFSIQIWQVSRTDPEKFAQWTTFEPAKPAVAFLILVWLAHTWTAGLF